MRRPNDLAPVPSRLLRRAGLFAAFAMALMAADCERIARKLPSSSLYGDPPGLDTQADEKDY